MFLCLVGFFVFPSGQGHSFPTYLLAVWYLVSIERLKFVVSTVRGITFVPLLLGLFFYLVALTAMEQGIRGAINASSVVLLLLTFVFSTAWLCHKQHAVVLLLMLPGLVAVAVGVSNLVPLFDSGSAYLIGRLEGGARLDNPTIMGLVYGYFTVSLFSLWLSEEPLDMHGLLIVCVVVLASITLLTGSRGASFSMLLTGVLILLYQRNILTQLDKLMMVIVAVALIAFACAVSSRLHMVSMTHYFGDSKLVYELDLDNPDIKVGYYDNQTEHVTVGDHMLNVGMSDSVSALVFPSFNYEQGFIYYFDVLLRSSKPSNDGVYIRFMEREKEPEEQPAFVTLNSHKSEAGTLAADREVMSFVDNVGVSEVPKRFIVEYFPAAEEVTTVSPLLMRWHGLLDVDLHVLSAKVVRKQSSFLSTQAVDFDVDILGRPTLTGLKTRAAIWAEVWGDLEQLSPTFLIGRGLDLVDKTISIRNRNGFAEQEVYEHPHSLYVSVLRAGGLLGLLLFVVFLYKIGRFVSAGNRAPSVLFCFASIVYAALALILDGGALIEKISYIWLIFWFPIGVIIGLSDFTRITREN